MYDSALRDFRWSRRKEDSRMPFNYILKCRDLERELLLTASFYVRKAEQVKECACA